MKILQHDENPSQELAIKEVVITHHDDNIKCLYHSKYHYWILLEGRTIPAHIQYLTSVVDIRYQIEYAIILPQNPSRYISIRLGPRLLNENNQILVVDIRYPIYTFDIIDNNVINRITNNKVIHWH